MLEWVELVGYAAAAMTVVTYSMRTMMPLRIVAILANGLFLIYSGLTHIYPSIVLHSILLPFNAYRLWELIRLTRSVRDARARGEPDASDFEILRSAAPAHPAATGTYVFRKGDPPDFLYQVEQGTVLLEELGVTLGPGEVFGEIAFFTDSQARTASARCESDCLIRRINEDTFMKLYFQSPRFGITIQRLITRRLLDNLTQHQPVPPQVAPPTGLTRSPAPAGDDARSNAWTQST